MKLFVYSMRPYDEAPIFKRLCAGYNVEFSSTEQTPCLENVKMAEGYDVVDIITTPMTEELLRAFRDAGVRCIATRTIGYDHIDLAAARKLGLGVVHVTYSPSTVADYAIMMMLIGLRRLPFIMKKADAQDFTLKGSIGREIEDCTVGVIGTGRIGKTVIRHLAGFGCRILAYDVYPDEKAGLQYVSLDRLLQESDVITLHAPGMDETWHMIGEKQFARMKDGVVLINCARGSLIDSDALRHALDEGKVGFAGLDVVEHEEGLYYFNRMGEPLKNPELALLKSYPNVLITPHTAFYTERAVSDMAENSITAAMDFMEGRKNPFIVS